MVFNDSTGNLGICQEVDSLCDSNTTSYPLTTKARRFNNALEELIGRIMQVCKNFPFDDENLSDLNSGTFSLSEGVSKYTITDKFLDILEVKVKDNSGVWHIVKPTSQREESTVLESDEASLGLPIKYRMDGRTMRLSPAPTAGNVTLANGLKFVYSRTGSLVTGDNSSGDNGKVPGIASPWHITLAKMIALPYCKSYKKDRVQQLMIDIDTEINGQGGLLDFYSNRQKDRPTRITIKNEDNR